MAKKSKIDTSLTDSSRLLANIRELILSARKAAARSVDLIQVLTSFEIGRRIVEHEQNGSMRAEYGKKLLIDLAASLTSEFGRGFSHRNLDLMRKFYLLYLDRSDPISQTVSAKCLIPKSPKKISDQSANPIGQIAGFSLSWSHYVFLLGVQNADERRFYEIESASCGWSLRELKRQFNSGLYERLALSQDKDAVRQLAQEGQIVTRPEDLFKEPYVLEFLGLSEQAKYSETDLESAIINRIETFLLELGKGFLFEARQKRFTFDEEHYFVDLVFYNRLLRCYVLVDLKLGKLTHQDLGQMQMYVNYFDRHVKLPDENPAIGIVLCKKKHDALVEITLPSGSNIHAREYQLYLPDKEELRQKLMEWTEEEK